MHIEIFTRSGELPELIEGSAIHSAHMFKVLEKSMGCKPYMLVAYDGKNNEIGHLLIAKRRDIRIIPPVLSFWYSILGEGVYCKECSNREEIFSMFIEKVFDMFDFHHTFIEVQNIEDSRFAYSTFKSSHSLSIIYPTHLDFLSNFSKLLILPLQFYLFPTNVEEQPHS